MRRLHGNLKVVLLNCNALFIHFSTLFLNNFLKWGIKSCLHPELINLSISTNWQFKAPNSIRVSHIFSSLR